MGEEGGELLEEAIRKSLDFLSTLTLRMSVEDFVRRLLEITLSLLPDFEKGSVAMRYNGEWRYVAWIGFPDEISRIKIREGSVVVPDGEEPVVIENIFERGTRSLPKDIIEKYRDLGTHLIKKTIAVAIKVEDEIIGAFYLDSLKDVEVSEEDLKTIKAFAKLASIFVAMKLFQEKERSYQRAVIQTMVKSMEATLPHTAGHSERVAKYSAAMAKELGLSQEEIDTIFWGAFVHDVGKLSIPSYILSKPKKLTPYEYEVIKIHTLIGEDIVRSIAEDYSHMKEVIPIVRNHHERWDGKGYPDGLKGNEIPLRVRIVTIADAFDAMTSDRPYRKAFRLEQALDEIVENKGKQFDPEIVDVVVHVLEREYRRIKGSP